MTIGEVSKNLNISIDTLRYYERIGLIGPIPKTKNGIRDFDKISIKQIEFVKCMRSANFPIEMLTKYMNLYKKGDSTFEERRKILIQQRQNVVKQIEELQRAKEKLDYKVQLYDKKILEKNIKGD